LFQESKYGKLLTVNYDYGTIHCAERVSGTGSTNYEIALLPLYPVINHLETLLVSLLAASC